MCTWIDVRKDEYRFRLFDTSLTRFLSNSTSVAVHAQPLSLQSTQKLPSRNYKINGVPALLTATYPYCIHRPAINRSSCLTAQSYPPCLSNPWASLPLLMTPSVVVSLERSSDLDFVICARLKACQEAIKGACRPSLASDLKHFASIWRFYMTCTLKFSLGLPFCSSYYFLMEFYHPDQ